LPAPDIPRELIAIFQIVPSPALSQIWDESAHRVCKTIETPGKAWTPFPGWSYEGSAFFQEVAKPVCLTNASHAFGCGKSAFFVMNRVEEETMPVAEDRIETAWEVMFKWSSSSIDLL
jgi:hypothetical protein